MHTRREFIQGMGIALASLLMTRCALPGRRDDSPRGRLRDCWQRFDWLAKAAQDTDNYERGNKALEKLVADHQAGLDELVDAGEVDQAVAEHVQTAFSAAAYHVWRANAPITCYEAVMIDFQPTSSGQLAQQAALLAEMADEGDVDPQALAQANAAIERDIVFLNLSGQEIETLYQEVAKRAEGGYLPFEEVEFEITPQAAQAAQFLVDLLLVREG